MKKLLIILSIMSFGIYSMPVFAAYSTPDITQQTKQLAQWESAGIKNASDPKIKQLYEQLSKQISEYNNLEQEYISQLQENADAMKETEQSTENKLLGGAAIGATGIGAMQLASGASEQDADKDAETAMRAYLATFHCNYGDGKNIPGGEQNVQLPVADLLDLRTQYINLANSLKIRKTSLEMHPGIESEAILDSASTGLYDDVALGKTDGAFTSLSRALTDKASPDATEWEQQKSQSAKKIKTGGTTAAVGAVGSAIGNLIINKDAPKENSKKIKTEFEKKSRDLVSDIYATEKELSAAIENNKKKIAEYNETLTLHQEFVRTITQAGCIEKFREYIDYINGLKPFTDDFANTADLNIKYDITEQKTAYAQCVTDAQRTECASKPNHVWQNGACVDQNAAPAKKEPADKNAPPVSTTTDDDYTTCLDRKTNQKISTIGGGTTCTTDTNRPGFITKADDGYCECIEHAQTTCTLNGKNYKIGTACSTKKGGKKNGKLIANTSGKCTCQETCNYNGTQEPIGTKCNREKSLEYTLTTDKQPHKTGTTIYKIIGELHADKNNNCTCKATQCPIGRISVADDCTVCDNENGYFLYEDMECRTSECIREEYTLNWLMYDSPLRPAAANLQNAPDKYTPEFLCQQFCKSNEIPDQPYLGLYTYWETGKNQEKFCKRNGTYLFDSTSEKCICNPSEEDRARNNASKTDTTSLAPSPTQQFVITTEMAQRKANAKYKESCNGGGGYCVTDFKNIQVQHLHAEKFAWAYILNKYNQEAVCNSEYRQSNNEDYIQCTTINGTEEYFEFQFDDITESIDETIDLTANQALEKILGTKYQYCIYCNGNGGCMGDDKWRGYSMWNRTVASRIAAEFGGKIIDRHPDDSLYNLSKNKANRSAYQNAGNCKFCKTDGDNCFDWTEAFKNEKIIDIQGMNIGGQHENIKIENPYNIDPYTFYLGIQLKAAPKLIDMLYEYVALQMHPQNITAFTCQAPYHVTGTINNNPVSGSSDDVVKCNINNGQHYVSFVFDDMSENFDYYNESAYQRIACASLDGIYSYDQCIGVNELTCKRIALMAGGANPPYWDSATGKCMLPESAKQDLISKGTNIGIMIGGAIVSVAVTYFSLGTGTGFAVAVISTVATVVETSATIEINNEIKDFISELQKCNEQKCAEAMLKTGLSRMANLQNDMTGAELNAIDKQLARLAELIPENSEFYQDVLAQGVSLEANAKDFFDPDSWEPEQVIRAVAIAVQLIEVGAALTKGLINLFKSTKNFTSRAIRVFKQRALTNLKWVDEADTTTKIDDLKRIGINKIKAKNGRVLYQDMRNKNRFMSHDEVMKRIKSELQNSTDYADEFKTAGQKARQGNTAGANGNGGNAQNAKNAEGSANAKGSAKAAKNIDTTNELHPMLKEWKNATTKQKKQAKNALTLKYHPDKVPAEMNGPATQIMQKINNIENLSDEELIELSQQMNKFDKEVETLNAAQGANKTNAIERKSSAPKKATNSKGKGKSSAKKTKKKTPKDKNATSADGSDDARLPTKEEQEKAKAALEKLERTDDLQDVHAEVVSQTDEVEVLEVIDDGKKTTKGKNANVAGSSDDARLPTTEEQEKAKAALEKLERTDDLQDVHAEVVRGKDGTVEIGAELDDLENVEVLGVIDDGKKTPKGKNATSAGSSDNARLPTTEEQEKAKAALEKLEQTGEMQDVHAEVVRGKDGMVEIDAELDDLDDVDVLGVIDDSEEIVAEVVSQTDELLTSFKQTSKDGVTFFTDKTAGMGKAGAETKANKIMAGDTHYAAILNTEGYRDSDYMVIAISKSDAKSAGYKYINGTLVRSIDNSKNMARLNSNIGKEITKIGKHSVKITDFGVVSGRPIAVVQVGNKNIPFYISTGSAGKTSVPTGKWEFFGGISISDEGRWFRKGSLNGIIDHYRSPELKQIADALDNKIGDLRDTEFILETMGRETLGGTGNVAKMTNGPSIELNIINKDITNFAGIEDPYFADVLSGVKEFLSSLH